MTSKEEERQKYLDFLKDFAKHNADGARGYATQLLRNGILLNGAALLAIPAFFDFSASTPNVFVFVGAAAFVLGILSATTAMFFAYWHAMQLGNYATQLVTEAHLSNGNNIPEPRFLRCWIRAAILFFFFSYLFFSGGAFLLLNAHVSFGMNP